MYKPENDNSHIIYANNAATTPIKKKTLEAMMPYLTTEYGNPSSIDAKGKRAKMAVEDSRKRIAEHIGCFPDEIIFTSGGTESNNMAIKGVDMLAQAGSIATTEIEHHSVLEAVKSRGASFTKYIPIDHFGRVKAREIVEMRYGVILSMIAVASCNNETGILQDIDEIIDSVKAIKKAYGEYFLTPLLHIDNVQGMAHLPYDDYTNKCDSFSFAGHKFGAPKGVGGLYVKRHTPIHSLLHGGGQEMGLRAGTENVAGIVGMAAAMDNHTGEDNDRLGGLTDLLYERIMDIEGSQINSFYHSLRAPGIINISFKGLEAESLLIALEQKGIIVSAGSACTAGSYDPSHVLKGMRVDEEYLHGTIRISLGDQNTLSDIEYIAETLNALVPLLRMQKAVV